jgi:hypothetical protein
LRVFAIWLLAPSVALAVSPLTVDDADPVSLHQLQLNAVPQCRQSSDGRLYALPFNPVYGVADRGELGATIGYLRFEPARRAEGRDAGTSDLVISTKWLLFEWAGWKLSGRLDVGLPVASERPDLGTGNPEVGGTVIATRCWGGTCVDANAGYLAVDVSRSVFRDDQWFLGQALRQQMFGPWTLLAEVWALIPNGETAAPANVHFDGGVQWALHENLTMSGLVGSAVGRGSPDWIGRFGVTWVF